MGGISALVGIELHLPRGKAAVGPDVGDQMEADGVAHAVGDEGVLPRDVQLDQAAAELHADPGNQRLIEGVLLVAEAAADIGLDDTDAAPVHAQSLSHGAADDVRDLGGGYHHDLAGLFIGIGDMVFDVAVLDGGGVVPLVHADQARLADGGLKVALADGGVLEHVVGIVLVQNRRAGLHGLLRVEHKGQRFILHLDQAGGLGCCNLIFSHNGGHIVAVVAHMAVEQIAVGDILMGFLHRPGVTGRGERKIRHVKAGKDPDHAGDLQRLRDVHGLDDAMRHGGSNHPRDQRVSVAQIVGVLGAARGLVEGVNAGDALAYRLHTTSLLFRRGRGEAPSNASGYSNTVYHGFLQTGSKTSLFCE